MPGMGDTSTNIAPPQPLESAQTMGGFGVNPAGINMVGASPEMLQEYQKSLQGALNSLQQRVLHPTGSTSQRASSRLGRAVFSESLGRRTRRLGSSRNSVARWRCRWRRCARNLRRPTC